MQSERKTILYIDDDYQSGLLVKVFLERENYNVLICQNTKEAREKLAASRPDLLITDIGLPVESGLQFYDWFITSEYKDIPLLFVSAHAVGFNEALTRHKDIFFEKPIYFPKLIQRIKTIFQNAA
jgi:DNA-binding response OmpR family regulator